MADLRKYRVVLVNPDQDITVSVEFTSFSVYRTGAMVTEAVRRLGLAGFSNTEDLRLRSATQIGPGSESPPENPLREKS